MCLKPNILVVDDDAITRMLVSEVLGKNGFEVQEAKNGREGLEALGVKPPDLVLLDVMMPEMDGFEFLHRLTQEQKLNTPVVMMTAVDDVHRIELAYQLGATDFFGKPIQWLLLPYRLRFVLRNHQMTQMLTRQQQQLKQSSEQLRLSLSASKQGLWELNLKTGQSKVNAEYAAMLGFGANDLDKMTLEDWFEHVHPDDQEQVKTTFFEYLHGARGEYRSEFRQQCADGSWKWLLTLGSIVDYDESGRPYHMLGTHTDIHASKLDAERLQLLAKVFENSGEAILICDENFRVLSSNQAFSNMTGYLADEVAGTIANIFSAEQHHQTDYQRMSVALEEKGYWQGELWDLRKNGERYPIALGVSTTRNTQDKITHYISIFSDITERKAAQLQIEYLARHDPLTNLPNRTLLRDRFEQGIAQALRNNTLVAVLFLDLDRFKQINDTMGHNVGDRLLQGIAERLCQNVRQLDTVCRQGGDEFIIILTDIPDTGIVTRIAQQILAHLHEPFCIDNVKISTSFSIGISMFPTDGVSFHGLLSKADTAMYTAKNQGRNTFKYFHHDMNLASMERNSIEHGLKSALENQELTLEYQPLYSFREQNIVGAEALLRWHPHNGAVIPPCKFIPIAEENGLIVPIGNWVMEEACRQVRKWHDLGHPLLISINISSVQIKRGNLVDSVKTALADSGLGANYLELELTESVLMDNSEQVIKIINELATLGVSFAIDDFGTGFSSLNYLKRFAVNKLKIDPSLSIGIANGKQDDIAILQAIMQLGKNLDLRTVAEGVETQAQAEKLADLGCHEGQGYLWYSPLPPEEFEKQCLNLV